MARLTLLVCLLVAVAIPAAAQTDIDVLYIQKTPLLNFNSANGGWPAVGSTVTWNAKVKNWGSSVIPFFVCEWWLNGVKVQTNTVTNLAASETRNITYNWIWQQSPNTLEFRADTTSVVSEVSELNNVYTIQTNALTIGSWVEQGVYDWFHAHQIELGDGANSFDDWCYRQVKKWNEMLELAVWPVSPNGIVDRVRMEKVVVVADGTLPLHGGYATNNPDSDDKTIDLMWGHPYYAADCQPGGYWQVSTTGPFFLDYGEMHELNHARYIVDHYGFDTHQGDPPTILVTDQYGNLVAGTALMPVVAWAMVYGNKCADLMGAGGNHYSEYAAGAWNRKVGIRGPYGNQNSPGDIGIYMQDLPQNNWFRFIDNTGAPLVGATISIYQATSGSGWYAKYFDNTADIAATTNSDGYVNLGRCPFSTGGYVYNTYGLSNATFIIKVFKNGQEYFTFGEVSDFGIEYWRGNTGNAYYTVLVPWGATNTSTPVGPNQFRQEIYNSTNLTNLVDVKALDTNSLGGFVLRMADRPISSGVDRNNFSCKFTRDMFFNKGTYKFYVFTDDGGRLYIDSTNYINHWVDGGVVPQKAGVTFASSALHTVRMDYYEASGVAVAALAIKPPLGTVPGPDEWKMEIYNSTSFTNLVEVSACQKSGGEGFALNWGERGPGPCTGGDGFSARFTRTFAFVGGTYRFTTTSDDGVRLYVDGQLKINNWTAHPPTQDSATVSLAPGSHTVVVECYDASGPAQIALVSDRIVPDFDVTYISRTPRYDRYNVSYNYSVDPNEPETGKPYLTVEEQAKQRWPDSGQTVTYTAHVRNIGAASAACDYKWYFDGVEVGSGTTPALGVGGEFAATYSRPWDSERFAHIIRFVADPADAVPEAYENNNSRTDFTNALSFRLHVWQSLYNWFAANAEMYANVASFEDWAQQNIGHMNRLLSEGIYPGTPEGIPERVRIDEIVVEPDGTPDPDPSGAHAPLDWPWDGRRGFTNDYLADQGNGKNYFENNVSYLVSYDPTLIRALSYELGLVSPDALNIPSASNYAQAGIGHANTFEQAAITSGGPFYSEHEAYALTGNLHMRRGFSGEYLYDVPRVVRLRVLDAYRRPLPAANVKIYQEYPGKTIPATLRFDLTTDSGGCVTLPNRSCFGEITTATGHTLRDNPFGIVNTKGENGVFFAKVTSGSVTDYQFIEILQMNIACWLGYGDDYTYDLQANIIPEGKPTTSDLYGVKMHSPTFGYAVGTSGKILRYDGSSWSLMTSPATTTLIAVDVSPDGSTAIAVGSSGVVLICSSGTWAKKTFPSSYAQYCCATLSNTVMLVGGAQGDLYRTTNAGASWTKITASSSSQGIIRSIRFFDSNRGMLIPSTPPIFYTADGGVTWTAATGIAAGVTGFTDGAIPALSEAWSANTLGAIYFSSSGGGSWSKYVDFGTSEQWYGMDMWTGGSGWAVSRYHILYNTTVAKRFDEGRWFNQPVCTSGTQNYIYDVSLTSANEGWMVGKGGLILRLSRGPVGGYLSRDTIAAAKALPDGARVVLPGKVVTAVFAGALYMEESDRSSGIQVQTTAPVAEGYRIAVSGQMTTLNGERAIIADSVTIVEQGQTVPPPLGMTNRDLGGGAFGKQLAVEEWCLRSASGSDPPVEERLFGEAVGLNNIGLLVMTPGVVTDIDPEYFYIHDGSGFDDGDEAVKGVRVAFTCPADLGDFLQVTGLSSCTIKNGHIVRLLRPRRPEDIVVLRP